MGEGVLGSGTNKPTDPLVYWRVPAWSPRDPYLRAGHCQGHPNLASIITSHAVAVNDSIKVYYQDPGGSCGYLNLDVSSSNCMVWGKTKGGSLEHWSWDIINPGWLTSDKSLATSLGWNLVFDPSPPKNSHSWALEAWVFLWLNDKASQHLLSAYYKLWSSVWHRECP